MKIFIAGATGVLGRRLIRQLRARGHEVAGLARSEKGERIITSLGGTSRRGDLFDADSLARAAEGADVVIHAATSIPAKPRPTLRDFALNDRLRRDGTRALASAAAKIRARLYLQQSILPVARPADGSFFDEDSPAKPDALSLSAFEGENIAREAGQRGGFAVGCFAVAGFTRPTRRTRA